MTLHHLYHLPHIIKQCSSIRNISTRSLEREIGNYKKKIRARTNVHANASNVLLRTAQYKYLENTGIIDFGASYNRNPDTNRQGFKYHPTGNRDYPQLWEPFLPEIDLALGEPDVLVGGLIPLHALVSSIQSYKHRFLGVPLRQLSPLSLQAIVPTARMWADSHTHQSALFKSKFAAGSKRGGEYVMFSSTHKTISRGASKAVSHWYVGKILFYFEYNLQTSHSPAGSFYAVAEVMSKHSTAAHSKSIPLVCPFGNTQSKKYAVFDVADIISTVGLLEKSADSQWLFVISPTTAFSNDMSKTAGSIVNL